MPAPTVSRDAIYAISLGDSYEHGVGAVLRVRASSEEEAVARAKKLANLFFDGSELLKVYDVDAPGADSLRIYLDGQRISVLDIQDVEDDCWG